MPNNPTDPGAEMKARARAEILERLVAQKVNSEFTPEELAAFQSLADHMPVHGMLGNVINIVAAFAAKEVARSEKVAMAVAVLLRAKCSDKEWEALPKELTSIADDALARAVEEEREKNCKAVCSLCSGDEDFETEVVFHNGKWKHKWKDGAGYSLCGAYRIHERSQVKGEGL